MPIIPKSLNITDRDYQHDVTEAERIVQRMRRGGAVGRVFWLLNEKAAWGLRIDEKILEGVRAASDKLDAIKQKLDEGVEVDLGPTNTLLQAILDLLSLGEESGQAESLNLTLGEPQPNV